LEPPAGASAARDTLHFPANPQLWRKPVANVTHYVAELQSEMVELIHADPQTPEERHQVFLLKKRVVDTVLKEARIDQNREIHIKFRSDYTTGTKPQ
jgi:hypothetical protein